MPFLKRCAALAALVILGATVMPASASWSSDFDGDNDVDLADFAGFAACFNGPNRSPAPFCAVDADLDGDGDVDMTDFVIFAACFNGPNRPPACAPDTPEGMVRIPAGEFQMGDTFTEGYSSELPVHTAWVDTFYLDKNEVAKALWDTVSDWATANEYDLDGIGFGKAADHPAHSVNWFDCVKWCNARSQEEGRTPCYYADPGLTEVYRSGELVPYVKWDANGYRLPTQAEWEKAARGGVAGHRFPWSDSDNIQHARGNYYSLWYYGAPYYPYDTNPNEGWHPTFAVGGGPYTSPVGYFAPNGYGLYDMAGNVWEWCHDWYGETYYSSSPYNNPRGPTSGTYRVVRGGSWFDLAFGCRVAAGNSDWPDNRYVTYGFRCAVGTGTDTPAVTVTASGPATATGGSTETITALATGGTAPFTYFWQQTAGGTAGSATLNPADGIAQSVQVTFSTDAAGTFAFEVTVFDSAGQTAQDTVSVAVTPSGIVTLTFVRPASAVDAGPSPYTVEFSLEPSSAVGTVTLSYARDDNNDGQPDNNWIPFASNLTVGQSTAQFNADSTMASGKYLFHGAFTPAAGTPYTAAQAVAPGSLTIITGQSITVTGPVGNILRSWGNSVTTTFTALDTIGESYVWIFLDENKVFGDVTYVSDALAENATTTQFAVPYNIDPGLYFVGAMLYRDDSAWTFDYAPGAMLVRGSSDPAIPAGALVVVAPDENVYLQPGNVLEAKWFINSTTPTGSVTVFLEGIDVNGNPNGIRTSQQTSLDPAQCIAGIATEVAAGKYFVGVSHHRTDGTSVTEYATGAVTIMSATRPFVDVSYPVFNTWVRRGEHGWIDLFAHDPISVSTVDLFHDRDKIFGNQNEVPLISYTGAPLQDLQITGSTRYEVFDTSNMAHGVYTLGASMKRVAGDPIAYDYAQGRLLVWDMLRDPIEPLEVIAPVAPSITVSEGADIGVRWFVFTPSSAGTIRVFAESDLNDDGIPDGSDYRVYAPQTLMPYDSAFDYPTNLIAAGGQHGYFMGVTYTPEGGSPTTRYAPGVVFVRSEDDGSQ